MLHLRWESEALWRLAGVDWSGLCSIFNISVGSGEAGESRDPRRYGGVDASVSPAAADPVENPSQNAAGPVRIQQSEQDGNYTITANTWL